MSQLCIVNLVQQLAEIEKQFITHKTTKNMYALKNKVQLVGNIGNAPEIKEIAGGKKVANFSMATNEVYKNANGEKQTETQWHRMVAWGKLAELIEKYTTKGSEIMIEGKLINRSYVDKNNETKYITEVEVREIMLMGGASQNNVA
jgi:single-strand DNA-binding protein